MRIASAVKTLTSAWYAINDTAGDFHDREYIFAAAILWRGLTTFNA